MKSEEFAAARKGKRKTKHNHNTLTGKRQQIIHYSLIPVTLDCSYFQLLIHKSNLQSCLCQYVKDLFPIENWELRIENYDYPLINKQTQRNSGEYRGRTDDLLHAMQAL